MGETTFAFAMLYIALFMDFRKDEMLEYTFVF